MCVVVGGSRQTQENMDRSSGGPGAELVTDVRNPGKQMKQSLTLGKNKASMRDSGVIGDYVV